MKKLVALLAVIFLFLASFLVVSLIDWDDPVMTEPTAPSTQAPTAEATSEPTAAPTAEPVTEPVTEPTAEPTTEPPTEPPFEAGFTANSDPANWNHLWEIMAGGELVEHYQREDPIFFEDGNYFALPGIASFRGGNYRSDAAYGTADIVNGTMESIWKMSVGYLYESEWAGCGWTGQPLVVQWDQQTKQHMNLYEAKKNKEGLVEVIYAKMDGWVHFFDIEDGSATRDPLFLGMEFKGSGALDPRGYPILYVGSGLDTNGNYQNMYLVNLLDCTVMEKISCFDAFTYRWWFGMDSSPLVDADTDTIIWPCESGILYTFKLNTQYDPVAGTLSMDPEEPVKTRYRHDYRNIEDRHLGYESSAVIVENYAYIGDNAGMLHCVDLNTMELVWAQDLLDDINSTPVFDWGEDGNGYLYLAPSLDYSGGGHKNTLPICKIDARTGEIIWKHEMECVTEDGVSGGALASPLLGRPGTDIENLLIYSIGRSPGAWNGQVVALDKETGKVVWQFQSHSYIWSSPLALYTEEGKSYIFQADQMGYCYLLDGTTGQLLDSLKLGNPVEASPVAFGDKVVLGTRYGVQLFDIN